MLKRLAILIAVALVACSGGAPDNAANAQRPKEARSVLPRGVLIGLGGYATITDAPPTPFTPVEPGEPPTPSLAQTAASERFHRAGEFQNKVREEVQALGARLRTAEKGNFVDLYYENEGEPHVVFRFLHDAQATLAKYTHNPRFVAATARYSMEELSRARDFMWKAFREDRVILGGGIGNKQNRAEIDIAVTEPEFRALVARKGIKIPDAVELHFHADQMVTLGNQPLQPPIARLVRIFPRDNRGGPYLSLLVESRAKVILKDGCFRIDGGEHNNALVLFPIGAQLFIDRDGYLAYGQQESPGYARVGEEQIFPEIASEVTTPELIGPIHKVCGQGKVVKIHGMRSAAADRAQYALTQNANALRFFRDSYGLSEPIARKVLEACKARSGMGMCLLSPPPPPPPGGPSCPAGSKPSYGICRTPEGYIRPIPDWIQHIIRG